MRRLREGNLQTRLQLQENELKHVNLGIFAVSVYNIITKRCFGFRAGQWFDSKPMITQDAVGQPEVSFSLLFHSTVY